jgi:hypothetical protein
MNYYGYTSGYGMNPYAYSYGGCYNAMPYYGGSGYGFGYGAAIILVLFILLVVVFGAGFINGNER